MRISFLFLASAALLATACNAEKGAATNSGAEVSAKPVPAPNNGDWSTIVSRSPEGGFVMGNPNAKVKLVEFGSLTCPHCAEFEHQGGQALVDNYVKKGLVSWEFRNYVRAGHLVDDQGAPVPVSERHAYMPAFAPELLSDAEIAQIEGWLPQ